MAWPVALVVVALAADGAGVAEEMPADRVVAEWELEVPAMTERADEDEDGDELDEEEEPPVRVKRPVKLLSSSVNGPSLLRVICRA